MLMTMNDKRKQVAILYYTKIKFIIFTNHLKNQIDILINKELNLTIYIAKANAYVYNSPHTYVLKYIY